VEKELSNLATTARAPERTITPLPLAELEALGYREGAPDEETARIDGRCAGQLLRCEACRRGHTLVYRPFTLRPFKRTDLPTSYRAFLVCSVCRDATEF
jgi:hypothetical protein